MKKNSKKIEKKVLKILTKEKKVLKNITFAILQKIY